MKGLFNIMLGTSVLLLKVKTTFSKYLSKRHIWQFKTLFTYTSEKAESAETTDQWIYVALRKIFRCAGLVDAQKYATWQYVFSKLRYLSKMQSDANLLTRQFGEKTFKSVVSAREIEMATVLRTTDMYWNSFDCVIT